MWYGAAQREDRHRRSCCGLWVRAAKKGRGLFAAILSTLVSIKDARQLLDLVGLRARLYGALSLRSMYATRASLRAGVGCLPIYKGRQERPGVRAEAVISRYSLPG